MARPVSYNINDKPLESDISVANMPDGYQGEGFFATNLGKVVGLARQNSIWPLPSLLPAVVLNLWLPWPRITTWRALVRND